MLRGALELRSHLFTYWWGTQKSPDNCLSHPGFLEIGAGEEIRTLDIDLGKVALYH